VSWGLRRPDSDPSGARRKSWERILSGRRGRPPGSERRGHCQKRPRHAMAQLPHHTRFFRGVLMAEGCRAGDAVRVSRGASSAAFGPGGLRSSTDPPATSLCEGLQDLRACNAFIRRLCAIHVQEVFLEISIAYGSPAAVKKDQPKRRGVFIDSLRASRTQRRSELSAAALVTTRSFHNPLFPLPA
jgi:hypothetical protein